MKGNEQQRKKIKVITLAESTIKSEVSNFIQCSNNFNHYLYELGRSPLGPLAEICNVWLSQD